VAFKVLIAVPQRFADLNIYMVAHVFNARFRNGKMTVAAVAKRPTAMHDSVRGRQEGVPQ
jgi:hypothetical protein